MARKEEVLETNQNEIKRLEEELSACRAQKEVHQHEASMRSKDIEDLKTKLESTEQELRQSRKEVDAGIQRCLLLVTSRLMVLTWITLGSIKEKFAAR